MNKLNGMIILLVLFLASGTVKAQFEVDTIKSDKGNILITFIGHGTLMFEFENKIIHIDPVSRYADYSTLPKADLILITHHHGDHLDADLLPKISKENTKIVCTKIASANTKNTLVMNNGDSVIVNGIFIEAVPAYNIEHIRDNGEPFHPKGEGNGYVITLGDKRIYIAGDTEVIPEMSDLNGVDIAFLPMNLPYTMTPEMNAKAVNMINPKIYYPYHYGNSDIEELRSLLKDRKDVDLRIRKMK